MRTAVVVTLLAALAGCGAVGEPPFPGLRLPDPASWEDVGPVVICEGSARLGRPTDDTVGFCAAPGARPPDDGACTRDADCGSRERCTCGHCAVRPCDATEECAPTAGETTRTATVCSFADRRCDRPCAADADCAAGERCLPGRGVCRGLCATSADCQRGERCQLSPLTGEGLCAAAACSTDDDCGGTRCLVGRRPADLREPLLVGDTLWLERRDLATGAPSIVRAAATAPLSVDEEAAALPPFSLLPGAVVSGRAPAVLDDLVVFADAAAPLLRRARLDGSGAATVDGEPIGPGDAPALAALSDGRVALVCSDGGALTRRDAAGPDAPFGPAAVVLTPADVERAGLWEMLGPLESPSLEALRDAAGTPRLRLWFAAVGRESGPSRQFDAEVPTPPNSSVGVAAAPDEHSPFVVYDTNPVFDRVLEFLNHPGEREPAVAATPSAATPVQWMVYRRTSADGARSDGIAAARSPARPPTRRPPER
jgi:hypothetical protein